MKKFIDERRRLGNKHKQENELLENITKEESNHLTEENTKVQIYSHSSLFSSQKHEFMSTKCLITPSNFVCESFYFVLIYLFFPLDC